jgi:hypothetical protein
MERVQSNAGFKGNQNWSVIALGVLGGFVSFLASVDLVRRWMASSLLDGDNFY